MPVGKRLHGQNGVPVSSAAPTGDRIGSVKMMHGAPGSDDDRAREAMESFGAVVDCPMGSVIFPPWGFGPAVDAEYCAWEQPWDH